MARGRSLTEALGAHPWCLTCQHTHIAEIPAVTYACGGPGDPGTGCGFGVWDLDLAEAHATDYPDHHVYARTHTMVEDPGPRPALDLQLEHPEWAIEGHWQYLILAEQPDAGGLVPAVAGFDLAGTFHQWGTIEQVAAVSRAYMERDLNG